MTRVYVAGSSREMERAESAMTLLRSHGVEVAYDWCAAMRRDGPDSEMLRPALVAGLRTALAAVRRSEVLWLLDPEQPTTGAWCELGYAAGLGTVEIIVSGPHSPPPWAHAVNPSRSFALDVLAGEYCIERKLLPFPYFPVRP